MYNQARLTTLTVLFIWLGLFLAACGGQTPTPTPRPAATNTPTAEAEETAAEEMETAVTNAVTVADQALGAGNIVTIANVTSDGAGWLVIHAQADGGPGPILGFAPVKPGNNENVIVTIDTAGATETLYAMLHVDAGTAGTYEFPGDDVPAKDANGSVVTPPFQVTIPNAVTVVDQDLVEGTAVSIATVTSSGPGWLVIHAQADGGPGPVIGYTPVAAGANTDVMVEIDTAQATETLYAMLHVDAGTAGTYEFPGDDVPAKDAEGSVVTPSFQVTLPAPANAVTVEDQPLGEGHTVTIAMITSAEPGWLVIHAQADGGPGPVIGFAPVMAGENSDVVVEIDPAATTDTLYAMLHIDAGTAGEYEFPGDDVPAVDAAGKVVTPPFNLIVPTVKLGGTEELGAFLVANNGMTLYLFGVDEPNKSTCYDECAVAWPPLLIAEGEIPLAGDGLTGELGVTERDDGTFQVTYDGWPLYFWYEDEKPGDTLGQGVGDVWFVVEP